MNTPIRLSGLPLVLASAFLVSVVPAAPLLRVAIVPETRDNWLKPMAGFSEFSIPNVDETQPRAIIVNTYKDLVVSLSGQPVAIGGKLATSPARLTCRVRGLLYEQTTYPFHELLRSWVGSNEGFSLQVAGLRPKTKYGITFYAYDYGSPASPRSGRNHIEDALNPSMKPVKTGWDSRTDVLTAKSPLKQKSVALVTTSSADGRVLFIIMPDIPGTTALINGFEIEESR